MFNKTGMTNFNEQKLICWFYLNPIYWIFKRDHMAVDFFVYCKHTNCVTPCVKGHLNRLNKVLLLNEICCFLEKKYF